MAVAGAIGTLSVVWLPIALVAHMLADGHSVLDVAWFHMSTGVCIALTMSVVSTSAHHNAPRYFLEFARGRRKEEALYLFRIAAAFAFVSAFLFYTLCAVLANVVFRKSDMQRNISKHFSGTSGVDAVTNIWFSVNAIATIPHHMHACRRSLISLWRTVCPTSSSELCLLDRQDEDECGWLVWAAITTGLFAGVLLSARLIPDLVILNAWRGSTLNILLVFVFPCVLYLHCTVSDSDAPPRVECHVEMADLTGSFTRNVGVPRRTIDDEVRRLNGHFQVTRVEWRRRLTVKCVLLFGAACCLTGVYSAVTVTFYQ